MKKLILSTLLLVPAMAFAIITPEDEFALNRLNGAAQKYGLGTLLHKNVNAVVGKYSYAVQGGAVGDVNLLRDLNDTSSLVKIPDNAVVKQVWIDVLTQPQGASATVAIKLQSAGDLYAAALTPALTGIVAGVPTGAASAMIKLTAERTLQASIASTALTSGVFNVYVEYVLGD